MIRLNKYLLIFYFLLYTVLNSQAQQGTVASGGDDYGIGGSMSFSIGQIDYSTEIGAGIKITEGLQQPYKVSVIADTSNNPTISIYPTLTNDFVTLSFQNTNIENITYKLYDVLGKLIEKQKINDNQTYISFQMLADAMYFIKVFDGNNEVKTFKIIKN